MKQIYSTTLYPNRSKSLHKFSKHDVLNRQSVKTLTNFYNFYKRKSISNLPTLRTQIENVSPSVNNSPKDNANQINNQQEHQIQQMPMINQNIKPKKLLFPPDYELKVKQLLGQLCLNFQIFQKIFRNSHRKKTSMSKLYGWDQQFALIFFHGQQIAPNLSPKYIQKLLGLQKKTLKAKNTYNKLRLFTQQLKRFNRKHQALDCHFQGKKFGQSIDKLQTQIKILRGFQNGKKYEDSLRRTQNQLANMKIKIKNKGSELLAISEKTGSVRINDYFYFQENNIDNVQKIFRAKIF